MNIKGGYSHLRVVEISTISPKEHHSLHQSFLKTKNHINPFPLSPSIPKREGWNDSRTRGAEEASRKKRTRMKPYRLSGGGEVGVEEGWAATGRRRRRLVAAMV
jgi:hypothetical protein